MLSTVTVKMFIRPIYTDPGPIKHIRRMVLFQARPVDLSRYFHENVSDEKII